MSSASPTKHGDKAGQNAGESDHAGPPWSPMPFTGGRGGSLSNERDEYYRHVAAHPKGKDYLLGFHRPTKETATAVWSFVKPRLKLDVERILPPMRTRRQGDELTAKQALIVAFDAAVLAGDSGRMLTINTVFDVLARHWSDHYRHAVENGPATISYQMKANTIRASFRDLLRNGVRLDALWPLVRRGCRRIYTTERIPTRGYTVTVEKTSRAYAEFARLVKADRDYQRHVHGSRLLMADEEPEQRIAREVVGEWTYNIARVGSKSRALIKRLQESRFYLDVEALRKEVDRIEQRVDELNVQLWDNYKVDVTKSPAKPRGRGKRSPRQWAMKHIKVRDVPTVKQLVEEYDSTNGQLLQLQPIRDQLQSRDVARHITDGFLAVHSGFYKVVNRRYQPSNFWPVEVPGKEFLTERLETYVVDPESDVEAEHWQTTSRRGRLFKADATTSTRAREIAEEDPEYPREWLEDRQRLTGIDVSASQLQILAVFLGLKEIEATLVKTPFKKVFAEEICRRHRDQNDPFTLRDWNDPDPGDPKLKEAGKVSVMTYLYGSEPRQIAYRLRNAPSRFGPGLGDVENVTRLLTGSEVVREIMTVFRPACEALVGEAYRRDPYAGIRFTDPYDHIRVRWNPIRWTNSKVVRQKLTIFFRKPVGTPNRAEDYPVDYGTLKRPGKFRRMVRPMLIQMLDALFASLVVEELHERGVRDVVSVHDAWMVAADAEGELRSAFEAAGGPWLRALGPVYDDFINYLKHDPKYCPWAVELKANWKRRIAREDWPNFYAAATPLVEDDWR